jgi:hypothetical protein
MSGWDACLLEPNIALKWIECHPSTAGWLQAVFSVMATLTEIYEGRIANSPSIR